MKKNERRHTFSRTECQCALYLVFFGVAVLAGFLIDFLTKARPWQNANEVDLVGIVLIQMVLTVCVTGKCSILLNGLKNLIFFSPSVLPGRLIRLDAMINMEILTMKQMFVRYISHEIRY